MEKETAATKTIASSLIPPKAVNIGSQIKYWEKTVEWLFVKRYFLSNQIAAPLSGKEEAAGDLMSTFSDSDHWLLIEFKSGEGDFSSEKKKYPIFKYEKWSELNKIAAFENETSSAFEKLANRAKSEILPHYFIYCEIAEVNHYHAFSQLTKAIREKICKSEKLHGILKIFQGNGQNSQLRKVSKAHRATLMLRGMEYWCDWWIENDQESTKMRSKRKVSFAPEMLREAGCTFDVFYEYLSLLLQAKGQSVRKDGDDDWGFGTVMAINDAGEMFSFTMHDFFKIKSSLEARKNIKDSIKIGEAGVKKSYGKNL